MKKISTLLGLLVMLSVYGQKGTIILTDENLGNSFGEEVLVFEDENHSMNIEDILHKPDAEFITLTHEIPNLDFTTSRFWVKFSITNTTKNPQFILETARPVTNVVNFYQVRGEIVENQFKSGDDYSFETKAIPHRKNLFPIYIESGQTKNFYLEIESDGEVLTLPIKIYDKISFFESDYFYQFAYGFYFGIIILVIIIYFFFYVLLKDKSFLFYIIYVFWLGMLQFSLDGYSFQYIFPSGGYLANHIALFSAASIIIFLFLYVSHFLKLKQNSPGMLKVFKYSLGFVILAIILSLIPGAAYQVSYPIINVISLLSVILTLVAIFRLKAKGIAICNYFTLAFTVLIIGAIVFILGNFNLVGNAEISQNALKISSALEVIILSISMSSKYRDLQKEKEVAQASAYKSLEEKNAMMDQINVKLEHQVKERTAQIEHQKEELEQINEEILSSIKYAKRIQEAILPAKEQVQKLLEEYFVFYRPKDVVSGDFYFIESTRTTQGKETNLVLFAAVDCTGHGVPGAFMSIVGNNYLTQTLTAASVNSPADALDFLNIGVNKTLRQDAVNKGTVRDGMDISLCALDKKTNMLYFAGAKNPVYIVRKLNGKQNVFDCEQDDKNLMISEDRSVALYEIKGDKHPIGAYLDEELIPFKNHSIQLQKDDMVYVFTDGFADQFGGKHISDNKGKDKKYTYKRYKNLLMESSALHPNEQYQKLRNEFTHWKGDTEQLDDVLVIGVRIK